MRTTTTLDPDVRALLERSMAENQISFKQALNDAVRAGLQPASRRPQRTPARPMGPRVDLTQANALLGELEDGELSRKMGLSK